MCVCVFSKQLCMNPFRTDQLKRQYTGALCGLGYNPATGESLYYDHDIELVFDTLITQEDLDSVSTSTTQL